MDKIDRLGWTAGLSFKSFGLKIGIRVRDLSVLDSLLSRLPESWTPLESTVVDRLYSVITPFLNRRNVRDFFVLYGDHGRLIRTVRWEEVLDCFESDLDLHIAANAKDRVFLHAGAVRWNEHTILIPGRSQTGKTTLVAEFLRRGACYYSDDFAVVDPAGWISAYPRPLSVRTQNDRVERVCAEDIGARRAQPAPVSLVLLTEYAAHAVWQHETVSGGQGLLRLLENAPSARKHPSFVMDVLGSAIKHAEFHIGFRGEKEQTVAQVMNYLDHRSLG